MKKPIIEITNESQSPNIHEYLKPKLIHTNSPPRGYPFLISVTALRPLSISLQAKITRAPLVTSSVAAASPRPLAAPVISTVLPLKELGAPGAARPQIRRSRNLMPATARAAQAAPQTHQRHTEDILLGFSRILPVRRQLRPFDSDRRHVFAMLPIFIFENGFLEL